MSTADSKIRALVPFADIPFYDWQVLVHWTYMRAHDRPVTYLAYRPRGRASLTPQLQKMMAEMGADIIVWDDWRRGRRLYNPSMKPGLVGRYLETHDPDEPYLILDPDALPLPTYMRAADTGVLDPASDRWLGTNTDHYTGPKYLESKEGVFAQLCGLAGVNPDMVRPWPGIGAQLHVTGKDGGWWQDVQQLSGAAHELLKAHPSDVQVWCAEMYMTQILAIRDGIRPVQSPAMSMVWANGPAEGWDTAGFFHNAGVTGRTQTGDHMVKGAFQSSPFKTQVDVVKGSASSRYVEWIRRAETEFPNLIW